MLRKQIYLTEEQEERLAKLAELKGTTQAELIRKGIDVFLAQEEVREVVWEGLVREMEASRPTSEERDWRRDELYADRVGQPRSRDR